MIGTIRKHSKWLWLVIAGLTIISFIYWGAAPTRMGGARGMANGNYGTIYSHKVTEQEFNEARNEFFLFYWFRSHEWPDSSPGFSRTDLEREIYVRLMLAQKAKDLGIHVSEDAVAGEANQMLASLGRNGQTVPIGEFAAQILQPKGLTTDDFRNFARQFLVMEQLEQAIGLTGGLISPQEAAVAYRRDHQELSAQLVDFSASNYLSSVTVNPEAVAQFYTNYLAEYRLPDRVQVSYVVFEISNYLGAAEQKLGRTNVDKQVEMAFQRYGMQGVPGAKTPEEAKARIRTEILWRDAQVAARKDANALASPVFAQEPARPENLATAAQQKGLVVHVTQPFAAQSGPEEFAASPAFVKAAFGLTPEAPFAGPVIDQDAVYILAYGKQLPSEIPSLAEIHDRVAHDYQWREAVLLARRAGTNFVHVLAGMTPDHTFAALCTASGLQPQILPPFSLDTDTLPELGDRIELGQLKQAAFTAPVGKPSGFTETADGGFIVYVQSRLPIDQAKMNAAMPQYLVDFRRQRESEAFNQWLGLEANRQLRNTPVYAELTGEGGSR